MKEAKQPLGRSEYAAYISSPEWQEVRMRYWRSRLSKICYVCSALPSAQLFDLHHRTYKNLGQERLSVDLVLVCRTCHEAIHQIAEKEDIHIWLATKLARKQHLARKKKELKRQGGRNKKLSY